MKNDAAIPFPGGDSVDSNLDGNIMKFKISTNPANVVDPSLTKNYTMGNIYPTYKDEIIKVPLSIIEVLDENENPLRMLFNGERMDISKMC
jgi:hypothetical protein